MTRSLIIIALLFCVSANSEAGTLRVATLNCEFLVKKKVHIKYGFPFDLKEEHEELWTNMYRQEKLNESIKAIAKEIAKINADIIVLTEVGKATTVEKLKEAVGNEGVTYPHRLTCKSEDTATGQHVAVFSKLNLSDQHEKIPGREYYRKEVDDNDEGDTAISKGLYAKFQFEGNEINLYGLHLKSERGASEADAQRVAQASIVRRHYLPKLMKGEHVLVVGDLNDKRGDPALRRIRGLDDIQESLIQTGATRYFDKANYGERWTYEYLGERNQIDHILPSRSIVKEHSDISTEVYQPEGILPGGHTVTDHRALIVEFEI